MHLERSLKTWKKDLNKWKSEEESRPSIVEIMHKVLHPRVDVNRLYVSRKGGGRGLASGEDSVDTSI